MILGPDTIVSCGLLGGTRPTRGEPPVLTTVGFLSWTGGDEQRLLSSQSKITNICLSLSNATADALTIEPDVVVPASRANLSGRQTPHLLQALGVPKNGILPAPCPGACVGYQHART
jgi:hypothetical protein